jgi:hypothetical protein
MTTAKTAAELEWMFGHDLANDPACQGAVVPDGADGAWRYETIRDWQLIPLNCRRAIHRVEMKLRSRYHLLTDA